MVMYDSVKDYFSHEHESVMHFLGSSGDFWEKVGNNTISNEELEKVIAANMVPLDIVKGNLDAAVAVAIGRLRGKINNPG